jgi:hypothetical protein
MEKDLLDSAKSILTRIGARCPDAMIRSVDKGLNYLEVGRWMRRRDFGRPRRLRTREMVFDLIAERIRDRRVLYLEFGVWKGDSMRYWSRLMKHPESSLHGFDSFEGLPERWKHKKDAGMFSTGGQIPQIDDPRVKFFKGWFHETLKDYSPPPHDELVINIDADLYNSASVVLNWAEDMLKPGTYLYFDEFSDRLHELRAFDEFLSRSAKRFRAIAATAPLTHVAFQCES